MEKGSIFTPGQSLKCLRKGCVWFWNIRGKISVQVHLMLLLAFLLLLMLKVDQAQLFLSFWLALRMLLLKKDSRVVLRLLFQRTLA